MNNNITEFTKHLVEEAGITDERLQEDAVGNLEPILYDRLIVGLVGKLSEEKQVEVINLLEKQDREASIQFLQKNIPDFDQYYEKLLVDFGQEYLDGMQK